MWSITPSPNPLGPANGNLSDVACPSATSCFAVGSYFDGSTDKTLVERWNGTTWSIVASPNPSGAIGSSLAGVACRTATSCYAVGDSYDGSTNKTLVERWNGTTWSILTSPNPSGPTDSFLSGVSCPIGGSCFAVGSYNDGSTDRTLVERWNGTTWSIVTSPNPSGAAGSSLRDVSCRSATRCFAVGSYDDGSTFKTLTEHWDGTSWSIVPSPNPSGSGVLTGVSCPIGGSCYAVGSYSGSKTLVEHWNGTSWSILASPNPSGATFSFLYGVSCPGTTSCFAVGISFDGSTFKTLVERWNGTTWSIVSSPNPGSSFLTILTGVACTKPADCHAVGSSGFFSYTLAEHWDGTSWSIAAPPTGSSQSQLAQVSCPSATSCYAVGSYDDGSHRRTLVEHWNGTAWSIVKSPNPAGSTSSRLTGVSCPSTTSCYAVGTSSNGSAGKTLVEHWNGTSWSIVTSPNPSGPTDSVLSGVSCPSTTSCFAVGTYFDGSDDKTLVEQWNGTSWSIVASPNPSPEAFLTGVSCPSPTSCYAVGYSGFFGHTLVERWNGTSWSIVASPNPSGTQLVVLTGVSCPNPTSCSAVGAYYDGSSTKTLVERWNGTSWSVVTSPNPSPDAFLTGVSCASPTSCSAVGYFADATGKVRTLAERWNGTTWSIDPSPNPRGATDSFLSGVACPSSTSCYAVGDYFASVGDYTLVERYA